MRGVGSSRGFFLHGRKLSWLFTGGIDLGQQKPADLGDREELQEACPGIENWLGAQGVGGDIFSR